MRLIFVLIIFLNSSCGFVQSLDKNMTIGDGNITTKTRSTEDYDMLKVIGSMDVHLQKGTEGKITVKTDENLHEYLEIRVVNKELIVKSKNNTSYNTKHGIHITVPFENISKVKLTGSGDINTKDVIKTNEFNASVNGSGDIILDVEASKVEANVSGSGDINMNVEATQVEADVSGSGDIYLSGSTFNLEVDVNGSGDFSGFDLTAKNTDVSVSGSGDAEVICNKNLIARVRGSGDIFYKGNPDNRDVKTFGSGDVTSQ